MGISVELDIYLTNKQQIPNHMKHLLLSLFVLSLISCKTAPDKASLAGDYSIKAEWKNKEKIQSDVKKELEGTWQKVSDDLSKAQEDLESDFDLSTIDTTTAEGKIEYASKKLAKEVSSVGMKVGESAGDLGKSVGNAALQGLGGLEAMFDGLNLDVTLQPDGDIKTKGMASWVTGNMSWDVVGDEMIIKDAKSEEVINAAIVSSDDKGFVLEYKELRLIFTRK
jgi:hypothetical protein